MDKIRILLKLEEWAVFLLCIFQFSKLSFAWWWFPALLLLPDVGMAGYLVNSKVGAITYNFTHHRLVAVLVALYAIGWYSEGWKLVALVMFAHISLDRALGYGLKLHEGFHSTHLGMVGRKERLN